MKVLVTGGAGYIGSITVEQLIKAGEEVIVFDNLYQGHRDAVHPDAIFIHGDLADKAAIEEAIATHKPDGIMHFASYTLVGESMEKPFMYLRDNIVNGLNLIESAVKHGVQRFILSSTANLFDQPERMPIDENERIVPGSPYGESKFILERYLHWMDRLYGMRYACLRYFNACGATEERGEDHDPETHLIPLVLQVALGQREKIVIFGDDYDTPDGTCVRDYIHVVDLAEAHILAMRALADGPSRRYNLGNGRGFSVKQVIETAREVTGHPIPAEVGPRRPGDPAILIASSETIMRELGWRPQYPDLRTIIETAWRWHRAHPDGYEK
ncbi:MAG: UDP-glucose 4-epimerase GalE [Chloroflexi bacterium]|nr:MAG: UDP-glucose 4-epimerase GalE [Chloroflexota bacterium]